MREIYKTYSQKGKKQVKSTTISVALLVVATLIFSSALPAMAIQTNTKRLNVESPEYEPEHSTALAPRTTTNPYPMDAKSNPMAPAPIADCYTMYGYCAYDPGGQMDNELIYFDTCDPGTEEYLGDSISNDFIAGGSYGCDGIWYGVQYNNGLLYGMDVYSGDMWSIGGGGTGLNGLAYSGVDNRMFGVDGSDNIWEVDPDTGEQELMGNLGYSGGLMIGMAFDTEGVLYGWELVTDKLWIVNPYDPEAEEVGPLGISINYAQDGDFHRESGNDILYLTGYTSFGALYICDHTTGQCELQGNFQSNMEITGSCFINLCVPPEHDISLKSIDSPQTGRAEPNMDMTITVKNTGNNTETFDAQMEIIKCEGGPLIMEEYFDDGVIPEGWETDYWTVVNSNYAGGTAPEARVYRYDPYYGGQYYDNYIMSGLTDCTGLEKVNLKFRWAGDYYYPQYASVYVKFRRNLTSPWKDVTPWDNPVNTQQEGDLYEIGCYGFGEPMGEEFQFMWQYIGYYSYINYLYLDDITLEACGGCAEYAELVEDITLVKDEEIQLSFPGWTPSEWQNESSENTWEEYPIHAFIMCEGDLNPRNDDRWILIDLWYPWMHDIEVMSIDSPHEEGRNMPAQTFPVQATMRNVGQYAECCIPIDIQIGNSFIVSQPLYETDWPGDTNPNGASYRTYFPGYDNGWRDEHKVFAYYYGWRQYSGSYSGGEPPEAYAYYYYMRQDYHFYSAPLDVSGVDTLTLKFKWYINHYSGQGLYSLEAGYSYDLVTWYASFHEEPSSTGGPYEVEVPIQPEQDTMYIGLWVKGDPYYFNYWYVDDVELVAKGFTVEFTDFACQGPDIEPGQEATFQFEDWTPEFLAEETTGTRNYEVQATIEMEGDKNPGNDIKIEKFALDYWHDVGIDRVTSPVGEGHPREGDEVLWDNGEPNGVNGVAGSMYAGYSNIIIDDIHPEDDWTIQGGKLHFLWNSAYGTGNTELLRIYLFEDLGDCDPSLDEYPEPDAVFEANTFTEEVGGTYFSRPEVIVDFLLDEEVQLPAGDWYIGIQPDGIIDNIAYLLTADDNGCMCMADLPYWGYPRWSSSQYLWGDSYDIAFEVHGSLGGCPSPKAWITPGSEDIDAVVKNYGTFTKEDLTCYAQIYEFITDPENGTEVYRDEIGNIDLMEPLGGEKNLQFSDFTFADEGKYGLFMQLPTEPDDSTGNNQVRYGVWVDDTEPYCDPEPILDPPLPDGLEGWYVNDVTVTLNATDPWSNGVMSGVKEIRYTINGGAEQSIPGKTGSFLLTEDGNDILVEYWAVDYVGNVEPSKNSFTIDMDQTVPEVELTYEVSGGSAFTGWEFTFTANATDDMSGMERVEFLLNGVLQETVTGPGPQYSWTLMYFPLPDATFTAVAYDIAGLSNSDDVKNPKTNSHSTPSPTPQSSELPRAKPLPR